MTPQTLRRIVRELEIRARLEARLDSKMNIRRLTPPVELNEIDRVRYMKAYKESYAAFSKTDQKDW